MAFSLQSIGRAVAGLTLLTYFVVLLTPARLSSERAVEIRQVAPFVRAAKEQEFFVGGFNIDYVGLNASLAFYSGTVANRVLPEELSAVMARPKAMLLVAPKDWGQIQSQYPNLTLIRRTAKWLVAVNAPLNVEEVFQ
jgi:hypothetical protein